MERNEDWLYDALDPKGTAPPGCPRSLVGTFEKAGRGIPLDALRLIDDPATGFLCASHVKGGYKDYVLGKKGLWRLDSAHFNTWNIAYGERQHKDFCEFDREGVKVEKGWGEYCARWGSPRHTREIIKALPGAILDLNEKYGPEYAASHNAYLCDVADLNPLGYVGSPSGVRAIDDPFTVLDPKTAAGLFVTQSLPVDPAPKGETHPDIDLLFKHFDDGLRDYLLDAFGFALRGRPGGVFYFITGPGGEGKSTVFNAMFTALGPYCEPFSPYAISKNPRGKPSPSLEVFMRARIAHVAHEVPREKWLDLDRVKAISDGDEIEWRNLYEKPRISRVRATMMIAVNEIPKFRLDHPVIKERMRVLPFPALPPDQKDPGLMARLETDRKAQAVLLRMVLNAAARTKAPPVPPAGL